MPRYFFDIHDGSKLLRDCTGADLAGEGQIRLEAMRALPAIARDEIPKDGDQQAFTVLVRNESNLTVYTATLSFAALWLGEAVPPPAEPDN